MSRSRKKHPVHGITGCKSERWDKIFWHRRMRQRNRLQIIRDMWSEIWPHVRDVSEPYWFGKDGKRWVNKRSMALYPYNIRRALKK